MLFLIYLSRARPSRPGISRFESEVLNIRRSLILRVWSDEPGVRFPDDISIKDRVTNNLKVALAS